MSYEFLFIAVGIVTFGIIVWLVSKNLKNTLKVMSGWGIYEAYNFAFDFLIWPIIQGFYGVIGIIILILIALINNLIILMWYQKKKVDWFGVTDFEKFKIKGHLWVNKLDDSPNKIKKISLFIPAKILQFLIWLLNKNDIFAFVTLSMWQDSFITTIFLRHGKFDKLDKRDYIVFVSSTILSCLAWSVLVEVVIVIFKFISNLN